MTKLKSILEEWVQEQAADRAADMVVRIMAKREDARAAEAKAEAQVALLRGLAAKNFISSENANLEIERLIALGAITRAKAEAATAS
jgi:hypothetical protein